MTTRARYIKSEDNGRRKDGEFETVPERMFVLSVIEQALVDLDTVTQGTVPAGDHASLAVHESELHAWFFTEHGPWCDSFTNWCDLAGINPDYLRRRARRVADGVERVERQHTNKPKPKSARVIDRVAAYLQATGPEPVPIDAITEATGLAPTSVSGAVRFSPGAPVERVGPGLYRYFEPVAEPAA
jgi:hypothetical protein